MCYLQLTVPQAEPEARDVILEECEGNVAVGDVDVDTRDGAQAAAHLRGLGHR